MVFNWFRRKFDESATPPAEEKSNSTPQEEPQAQSAPDSEAAPQDAASDYLNFAKAAYKNIQQKQTQLSEAEEAGGDGEAGEAGEVTATVPAVESTVAQVAFEPTSEPIVEPTVPAADESTVTEAPASQTETTVPFWARAEADRQARLERLKATAFEVPPEVVQPAAASDSQTVSQTTEIPDLVFDE